MRFIRRLVMSGIIATLAIPCRAEIGVVEPGGPTISIPFREGIGLLDATGRCSFLACSSVTIKRGKETLVADTPKLLRNTDGDWALKDGDIIFHHQHIFPCMSEAEAALLLELMREHPKIRTKIVKKPADWEQRVRKVPSHG